MRTHLHGLSTIVGLGLLGATPLAVAAPGAEAGVDDAAAEVLVVSDPFARWDDTRWRVDAQVILPFPSALYASKNHEVQSVAFDVRLVTSCVLAETVGPRRKEVDCTIESAALSAAPWQKGIKHAQGVIDDNVGRLKGLTVRLQATADGRVDNLTLVGEDQWYRRTQVQYENLRQILWGAFAGFDLHLPKGGITPGNLFVEKTSRLFWMPSFRTLQSQGAEPAPTSPIGTTQMSLDDPMEAPDDFGGADVSGASLSSLDSPDPLSTPLTRGDKRIGRSGFEALIAPAALGRGEIAHRVDRYQGKYILQSTGEGSVDLGLDQPLVWKGTVNGVGVISPYDAILEERVWAVELLPSASNVLSEGAAGWPYRAQGRLQRLTKEQESDVGASQVVGRPGEPASNGLPVWPSLL